MAENYFPRGSLQKNLLPNTDSPKQRKRKTDRTEESKSTSFKLFGQPQPVAKKSKKTVDNAKEKVRKKKKLREKKKTGNKSTKGEDGVDDHEFNSHPLKLKTLLEDTLVLGAVREIREFEMVLSLPSGIKGIVKATKVSDVFTGLLEKMSEDNSDEENLEEVNLSSLYHIGDLLPCRVLHSESQTKQLTKVDLSISPTDVNKDISTANLHKDMVIMGVVQSIEDHGYTIDTGITGANIFLSKEDAAPYLKETEVKSPGGESQLRVAQPVRCVITKVTGGGRSVNVSLDPDRLSKAAGTVSSMAELVPGRVVTAHIQKVQDTMLQVSFAGAYHGCVDVLHLVKLEDSTAAYKKGAKHTAVVVYQCPSSKTFGLSLSRVHFERSLSGSLPGDSPFGLREGTKIKKAKIIHVYKKRGVICDLDNGYKGYAIPDDYPENNSTVPLVGNSLPCRVLWFQLFDMVALVTFKESVISLPFLGYGDLSAGQLIKGSVGKSVHNGLVIEFKGNKRVTGFVSNLQASDVPVKNVSEMFEKGTVLQLRVLQVQPDKRKLLLSHKKTLMESKLPVITSFDQFREGQTLHGTITSVADFGCVVMFYNGIRGLLHKSELSNNPNAVDPEKDFYIGQVIKCHVKRTFDPKSEKVHLSLKSTEEGDLLASTKDRPERQSAKSAGDSTHRKIFETDSATVTDVSEKGISITTDTMELTAFIPKMHLCDLPSQQDVALLSYTVGDTINKVMVWAKAGGNWIATCKPTLLRSASDRHMKAPYGLRKGKFTVGVIKEVTDRGIMVDFSNGNVGLCSHKEIPLFDEDYFEPGLTVKVIVLDNDLNVTMKVASREGRNTGKEIQKMFKLHFQTIDRARDITTKKSPGLNMKIGSNVVAHVTRVEDSLVFAKTDKGVKVIIAEKPPEDLKVGSEFTGCVLDIDPIHSWLIVTTNADVVKGQIKPNAKRLKMQLDKLISSEEAEVLYSTIMYHMVLYRKQLIYVPAITHLNTPPRCVGDTVPLSSHCDVVKMCGRLMVFPGDHKDRATITGTSHESLWSEERNRNLTTGELEAEIENKQNIVAKSMGITIGQTIEVVVKKVNRDHLLVRTDADILGRVHITELSDQDKCPMRRLRNHGGQKLQARVIGFLLKSRGELVQVTHPNFTKLSLELTTKGSKMDEDVIIEPQTIDEEMEAYSLGQQVTAFPTSCVDGRIQVAVSPRVHGVVDILDLTDKKLEVGNPEETCPYGQAMNLHVVSIDSDGRELILSGKPQGDSDDLPLREGNLVMGRIITIIEDSLYLQLPYGLVGRVFATDARDHFVRKPLRGFTVGQYHRCYVLDVKPGTHVALSMRPSRVQGEVVPGMDDDIQRLDDLGAGQKVKGYILEVTEDNILVSFSREVTGLLEVTPALLESHPELRPGALISTVVSSIKDGQLSLRFEESEEGTELMDDDLSEEEREPPAKKLKKSTPHSGTRLSHKHQEAEEDSSSSEEDNPAPSPPLGRKQMTNRREKVDENPKEDPSYSDDEDDDNDDDDDDDESHHIPSRKQMEDFVKEERSEEESSSDSGDEEPQTEATTLTQMTDNKKEERSEEESSSDSGDEEPQTEATTLTQMTDNKKTIRSSDEDSSSSSDDEAVEPQSLGEEVKNSDREEGSTKQDSNLMKKLTKKKAKQLKSADKPRLSLNVADAWEEEGAVSTPKMKDSSSESEEEENEPMKEKTPKKKTKQERLQQVKAEEEYLYKTERALMDSERPPETVDDFDRLVTTSPNSSIVWIRFMAFHLDAGDVEKARIVAERALKTISFREEQEKLNVWVAYMNLENSNGSEDSILKVFERALANCEPYRVFEHLIDVYTRSGKIKPAESLYNTMLKRFRLEKDVWVQYGTFLMHHGKADAARSLLQRSFKSLVKKDHIDVISRFAQLEYKSGEPDQGQTMFENVLSNYPKRTDIWSIYLDMVIKSGDLKNARQLFDRVITLNLSPKKIKFFFKRYLEFEKKHGTDEQINSVKQKAVEYVESKSGLESNDT